MNLRKGGRRLVVVVVVVSNGDRVRGITGTIPFYKIIFPRTRAKYTRDLDLCDQDEIHRDKISGCLCRLQRQRDK